MKIHPVGTVLFNADKRTDIGTDRNDEAYSRFSQFAKALKTEIKKIIFSCVIGKYILLPTGAKENENI
jgi:hypothetical protein